MKLFIVILILTRSQDIISNDSIVSNKGLFYGYWGYNRSFFSNSDIHFVSDHYNFILHDVNASDRPQGFSLDNYFNPKNITIPQYCFRLGYYISDHIHISLGIDHMKYVVDQNQWVHISGKINSNTNQSYNGTYSNELIQIRKEFLQFEHTNGLNLVTLQADYSIDILNFYQNKLRLKYNLGIGGIWVGTKSDVRIIDEGIDNDHHLAGYSLTVQSGPRLEFKRFLFLDFQTKIGRMTLQDVFIENESAPKRADHVFNFISYYGSIGVMFPVKFKKMKL
jgi:hypothetical protein